MKSVLKEKSFQVRYWLLLKLTAIILVCGFFYEWDMFYMRIFFLSFIDSRIGVISALYDKLSLIESIVLPFLGGLWMVLLFGILLPVLFYFLEKHAYWGGVLARNLEKRKKKHSAKMELLGEIMLFLFVLIPFPGTGPIAGIILADIFHIPYHRAIAIIAGGFLASIIVTALLVYSGFKIWGLLAV